MKPQHKPLIPLCLTLARIPLALALFLAPPLSIPYLVLWGLCGVSDALDGYAARKLNCATQSGARLDTVADLVQFLALLATLLPLLPRPVWLYIGVAGIFVLRISAYAVHFVRYRRVASIHTVLNKLTGFALFLTPFLLAILSGEIALLPLALLALISALEELLIVCLSGKTPPDPNQYSLFSKKA